MFQYLYELTCQEHDCLGPSLIFHRHVFYLRSIIQTVHAITKRIPTSYYFYNNTLYAIIQKETIAIIYLKSFFPIYK